MDRDPEEIAAEMLRVSEQGDPLVARLASLQATTIANGVRGTISHPEFRNGSAIAAELEKLGVRLSDLFQELKGVTLARVRAGTSPDELQPTLDKALAIVRYRREESQKLETSMDAVAARIVTDDPTRGLR